MFLSMLVTLGSLGYCFAVTVASFQPDLVSTVKNLPVSMPRQDSVEQKERIFSPYQRRHNYVASANSWSIALD